MSEFILWTFGDLHKWLNGADLELGNAVLQVIHLRDQVCQYGPMPTEMYILLQEGFGELHNRVTRLLRRQSHCDRDVVPVMSRLISLYYLLIPVAVGAEAELRYDPLVTMYRVLSCIWAVMHSDCYSGRRGGRRIFTHYGDLWVDLFAMQYMGFLPQSDSEFRMKCEKVWDYTLFCLSFVWHVSEPYDAMEESMIGIMTLGVHLGLLSPQRLLEVAAELCAQRDGDDDECYAQYCDRGRIDANSEPDANDSDEDLTPPSSPWAWSSR